MTTTTAKCCQWSNDHQGAHGYAVGHERLLCRGSRWLHYRLRRSLKWVSLAVVNKLLGWCAALLPGAAVVAAFFVQGSPAKRFLILYIAPLFLAAPLWIRIRLETPPRPASYSLALDVGVFLLSFLRFVTGHFLPFSGHMLFLTYSGLTTPRIGYRLIAVALLIETTIFKFWVWHDPRSWSLGLVIGLLAGVLYWRPVSRAAS